MKGKTIVSCLALLLALFVNTRAMGFVTSRTDANIDFRFNNPGARANAMGGAFIGVADDATAAYTNPAGLTILSKPEASIEFKAAEHTTKTILEDGTTREFDDTAYGVSFISYAKPLENITFTLYRHELVNIEHESDGIPYTVGLNQFLLSTDLDLQVATYGAGIGLKLHDRFSLGFSVGFAQMDYKYKVDSLRILTGATETYNVVNSTSNAEQYSAAVLYNPFGDLNVGLVYRYGPEFNTMYHDLSNNVYVENSIDIPDVYGVGLSYRLFNALTIAVDVNRIMYSDLLENFYYYDDSQLPGQRWIKNSSEFTADDTTEVHAGFEYVLSLAEMPVALRGGYYHRPEHNIRYTDTAIQYYQETRRAGEDDNIYSLGVGAVFAGNIQIDCAASMGDNDRDFNISFVYRFE